MNNNNHVHNSSNEIKDLSDYSLDSIKKAVMKAFSTSHPLHNIVKSSQFAILDELEVGAEINTPLVNRNREKGEGVGCKLITGNRKVKVERFEIEVDISDIKKHQWLRSVNQELMNLIVMKIRDKSLEMVLANLKNQFKTPPLALILSEQSIVQRALMITSYIYESMNNHKFLFIDRQQIPALANQEGFVSQFKMSKNDPLTKHVVGMLGGIYIVPVENAERNGRDYINYLVEFGSILLGFGHNVEVVENKDRTKLTIGVNCTCQVTDETRIDALILKKSKESVFK